MKSSWKQVISGVPQGLILGSVLFNIFVNDLDDWSECILSKSTDNTKLGRAGDTPYGCAAIQKDLNRLQKWTDGNLMMFTKGKCKVPHLQRNNPRCQYTVLAGKQLGNKKS